MLLVVLLYVRQVRGLFRTPVALARCLWWALREDSGIAHEGCLSLPCAGLGSRKRNSMKLFQNPKIKADQSQKSFQVDAYVIYHHISFTESDNTSRKRRQPAKAFLNLVPEAAP